jgi:hypothetical protein
MPNHHWQTVWEACQAESPKKHTGVAKQLGKSPGQHWPGPWVMHNSLPYHRISTVTRNIYKHAKKPCAQQPCPCHTTAQGRQE